MSLPIILKCRSLCTQLYVLHCFFPGSKVITWLSKLVVLYLLRLKNGLIFNFKLLRNGTTKYFL